MKKTFFENFFLLHRLKKSFHQGVAQFLNTSDLEQQLEQLMAIETQENRYLQFRCPGKGKLSAYVTVNPDEGAVDRIFGLTPSLFWERKSITEEPIPSHISWIPSETFNEETTVVSVENLSSMLPKSIATLLLQTREKSMDIAGMKLSYVSGSGVLKISSSYPS